MILLATLLGGVMGLVLELLYRSSGGKVPGLRVWSRATLLVFVTALMFGLRGMLPDFLSIVVANALLLLAFVTYLRGSHVYLNKPIRMAPWWGLMALSVAGVTWFTYVEPSFRGRTVSVVGTLGFIMVMHARLYARLAQRTPGVWVSLLSLLVIAGVLWARWLHAVLFVQADSHLYSSNWIQSAYTSTYPVILLVMTVGLALLASEDMRRTFEHQATHDMLTGAFNRRAVLDRLAEEMARSLRHGAVFSVLMLDLDHFKRVNDEFGHHTGDEVLKAFVRRLEGSLRPHDVLGRFGGEEFLVILPETGETAARATAQRILATVAQSDGALPVCTTSIGLTLWRRGNATVDDLVNRADSALYAAKANGRNRVELA